MVFSRALNRSLTALALTAALLVGLIGLGIGEGTAHAETCTDRLVPISSKAVYLGSDGRHSAFFQGQINGGVTTTNFWFDGVYQGRFYTGVLVTGTNAQISTLYLTKIVLETFNGSVRQVQKTQLYLRVCGTYWIKLA